MLEKQQLLGAWELDSWAISFDDGGVATYPFGEDPSGLIVYSDDGWMSACIARASRTPLPEDQPFRRIDPALLAESYLSYFHYAGRFRIEGELVVHTVTSSLNPNFVGSEQRRSVRLAGDALTLSGEDDAGGRRRLHTLHWRRSRR